MRYYDVVKLLSLQWIGAGTTLVAAALAGCAGEVSFESSDPAARLRAIHRAASENDRASIPELIKMLESDDPAIRLLSIRTLESMTGQTMGYDAVAPSYERTPAVNRWTEWYKSERNTNNETRGSGSVAGSDPDRPENRSTYINTALTHVPDSMRSRRHGEAGAMG